MLLVVWMIQALPALEEFEVKVPRGIHSPWVCFWPVLVVPNRQCVTWSDTHGRWHQDRTLSLGYDRRDYHQILEGYGSHRCQPDQAFDTILLKSSHDLIEDRLAQR